MQDHIHLVCEAAGKGALANGMRSLQNRITKKLNKLLGREGSAFEDRYHARALGNPRSVRNALAYVLLNGRKHGEHEFEPADWIDPYSSAYYFDGWDNRPNGRLGAPPPGQPPVSPPETWLLSVGWRRSRPGLISPAEKPG